MGSQMCRDAPNDHDFSLDPLSSQFKQTQLVQIAPQYGNLLQKIKNIRQVIDPRQNHTLKWYESVKYGFRLYGQVKGRRPVGQCLFYFGPDLFKDQLSGRESSKKKSPVIITTKISTHYQFCINTLIIYDDNSYYIGEIQAKKYQIPRAIGNGLLVTPQFIYEGQFDQGYPQGFGRYRTKFLQYTGNLKKGLPYGECIQKTSKGLFMGRISQQNKVGFLITPQNKRIQINQKIQTSQIKL